MAEYPDTFTHELQQAEDGASFLSSWLRHRVLEDSVQQVFDGYYASFLAQYGEYTRFIYNRQIRELEIAIRQNPTARVLDIGCGCGSELLWLARSSDASFRGIDLKDDRLQVANARARVLSEVLGRDLDLRFDRANLLDQPREEQYDVVWTQQTFHHLEPREQIVEQMAALTKPGGVIVIAEVNAWNPLIQLQMLKKRGIKTVKEYTDAEGVRHIYGDERITTPGILAGLFRKHGVKTASLKPFRMFANKPWADRFVNVEQRLPRVVPLFTNYNYVGRKPADAGR